MYGIGELENDAPIAIIDAAYEWSIIVLYVSLKQQAAVILF